VNEPEVLRAMLGDPNSKPVTIAVVGLSADANRPSHYVPAYMQQHGYRILPVNPTVESVLGEKSYAALADLPLKPDIVNVFRLPQSIPAIVDEMLRLDFQNLWVQSGIVNLEAAAKAEAGGIHVIMDHCIMIEHRRIFQFQPTI
jgi:predicted CoA-binding protein